MDERDHAHAVLDRAREHGWTALAVGQQRSVVPDPLTERKRDVLELLPTMRSTADVARDLALSINTVKTHQRGLYQKLGVDNRRQAVIRARQAGFLVPDRNQSPA